ncbi:MAG: ZIP family metal transporter [candidate division WOR-3 bacterium]
MTLIWIIGSTLVVSFIALIGIIFIFLKKETFDKLLFILVSLAGGALIGGAFLHLLPHSLEHLNPLTTSWIFILGFVSFFLLERILRWRHCHEKDCKIHPVTYLSLIGDSIHNFIDGVVIAASFLINIPFGIITTLVVMAHEIPQEIGDYSILIFGGMDRVKALFYNFISALTAFLGGLFGYFLFKGTEYIHYIMPFAAGNFFYISSSDLIPELHKEVDIKKSLNSFIFFILGIFIMQLIKLIFKGE